MIALSAPGQFLPQAEQGTPFGWASFPHPVQHNLVVGLPVLLSSLLFLILYRPGRLILFTSLLSFALCCSPPQAVESSLAIISLPCLAILNAFAVSRTDFRSPFIRINLLRSSPFLVLVFSPFLSMMIAFSIVIGNSQCSPCSLHFVSKSTNGTLVDQSMLKNLYNSEVLFPCASKSLFSS